MTGDDVIALRLERLEEAAIGARQAERDVDTLKLSVAHMEGEMSALRAEIRERDGHTQRSLARIHERLDDITTAESFEKGRASGESTASAKTAKVVGWTVMATIAFFGLVVALLTLILG